LEFIAYPSHGNKVFWVLWVCFEVLSKIKDEIINGPGIWVDLVAPDQLQDLFPCDHVIFMLNEQF
jgi:hypothetical protein